MKRSIENNLTKTLAKKHACYVLLTCNNPSEDGLMQVEMSYKGDAALAAFLLQGAQSIIDQQEFGESSHCCCDKVVPLE